jgi:F-type H+-transporting ATPase subunit a
MDHHPFTFFEHYLPFAHHDNLHVVTSAFVLLLLIVLVVTVVYPRLKNVTQNIVPSQKFSITTVFEIMVEWLANLCDDVIGPEGRKYLPFCGSMFIFILFANLLGLVPGFLPPTETWVTGTSIALISFIGFNYYGFRAHGWGYIGHFLAPVSAKGIQNPIAKVLIFLLLVAFQIFFASVEIVSTLLRPVTLSIRLTANISADHLVLETFAHMFEYLLPIPFMMLGIFVSFMQAFIFTILTMVYISMATAHDH